MIFWVKTHVKTALHYDVIKYFLSKICGRKVKKKFNQLTRRRILLMLLISTVETHCINVFSHCNAMLSGLFDFCRTGLNRPGETGLNRQVSAGRNRQKLAET